MKATLRISAITVSICHNALPVSRHAAKDAGKPHLFINLKIAARSTVLDAHEFQKVLRPRLTGQSTRGARCRGFAREPGPSLAKSGR